MFHIGAYVWSEKVLQFGTCVCKYLKNMSNKVGTGFANSLVPLGFLPEIWKVTLTSIWRFHFA
jgi:hypothetical protein